MNRDCLLKHCSIVSFLGGITLASASWAGPLGGMGGFGAAGAMGGALHGTMAGPRDFQASGALEAGGQISGRVSRPDDVVSHRGHELGEAVQTQRGTVRAGGSAAAATATGAAVRGDATAARAATSAGATASRAIADGDATATRMTTGGAATAARAPVGGDVTAAISDRESGMRQANVSTSNGGGAGAHAGPAHLEAASRAQADAGYAR